MATDLPKISAPAQRALASIDISSLEQLQNRTRKEISRLHGMGPNALGKLESAMKDLGLDFAEK